MVELSILGSFDLNSQADVDLGLGFPWVCVFLSLLAASSSGGLKRGLTDARPSNLGVWVYFDLGVDGSRSTAKFQIPFHHNRPLYKRALHNGGRLLHHLPFSCLPIKSHQATDSRRNSSEGTADQDHPPSSPAPASSGPETQSSAGSPRSGLLLLSASASSSGSGTQDHDPASTALHSCVACWQAANAPTVHLDRPGPDLVEFGLQFRRSKPPSGLWRIPWLGTELSRNCAWSSRASSALTPSHAVMPPSFTCRSSLQERQSKHFLGSVKIGMIGCNPGWSEPTSCWLYGTPMLQTWKKK
ncbi:unnamed protein product [Phytophthora fragariaefolia]|uniref:Unnamed protein product n=1 Tax=Phytophthora fragariaefolia TaxID=1490495 RepID=A0A9W6WWC3_9STRA|nr:unnamed protein product [Phytophthora fragariaefolia]